MIDSQVVIFDNDMDEELLLIQERAAEAIAAVVQDGAKACVQACYLCSCSDRLRAKPSSWML